MNNGNALTLSSYTSNILAISSIVYAQLSIGFFSSPRYLLIFFLFNMTSFRSKCNNLLPNTDSFLHILMSLADFPGKSNIQLSDFG